MQRKDSQSDYFHDGWNEWDFINIFKKHDIVFGDMGKYLLILI